jgi:hypothetical protein
MTMTSRLPLGVVTLCLVACNNALMVGGETGGAAGASAAGSGEPNGEGDTQGEGGAAVATGGATHGEGGATPATGGTGRSQGGARNTGGATTSTGGATRTESGGSAGSDSGSISTGSLPCDVLRRAGHRCVAAHSTVRLLVSSYDGPLYQVCKGSSTPGPNSCQGTTQDIGVVDGYADAALQDRFCSDAGSCTVSKLYDQSGHGNDLEPAPGGGNKSSPDNPANAAELEVRISGHSSYGVLIRPGMGYRTGCDGCNTKQGNGLAKGDEPQTIYMVTSQKNLIDGCCFDYGNAETTSNDDGNGTMETVYFGAGVVWGTGFGGKPGPWVMADLENGLFAGWENAQDQNISTNVPLKYDFVTAVVVGDTADKNAGKGRFALYGADARSGTLQTMYDGIRPEKPGYVPMQKQGSLILGTGGDNSDADGGRFYEGAMVSGAATKETVDALQDAIVAAGYGK